MVSSRWFCVILVLILADRQATAVTSANLHALAAPMSACSAQIRAHVGIGGHDTHPVHEVRPFLGDPHDNGEIAGHPMDQRMARSISTGSLWRRTSIEASAVVKHQHGTNSEFRIQRPPPERAGEGLPTVRHANSHPLGGRHFRD